MLFMPGMQEMLMRQTPSAGASTEQFSTKCSYTIPLISSKDFCSWFPLINPDYHGQKLFFGSQHGKKNPYRDIVNSFPNKDWILTLAKSFLPELTTCPS